MKQALSQLLAAYQLAEMAYNADQSDYKRQVMEQALAEYNQALLEADLESVGIQVKVVSEEANEGENIRAFLQEVLTKNEALFNEKLSLAEENETLKAENSLLKSQSIEKDQKISELEKSPLSANPATVESAPVAPAPAAAPQPARVKPLTGAAKAAVEAAAAKAAAEANRPAPDEPQPKKNS